MLFYLIYKSCEVNKMPISELEELAINSSKKNLKLGITGLLIRTNEGFIQYLEGDRTAVVMLYDDILCDKRHHSVKVVDKGNTVERKFEKWSMLLKEVTIEEICNIESNKNKSSLLKKDKHFIMFDNKDKVLELINSFQNHN